VTLGHLSGRFFGSLSRAAPPAEDREWAASVLGPSAYELWARMPHHDQRHSLGVARGVEAQLAGTPYAGDSRWVAAALLHDVGKLDARLGVCGRVAATMSAVVAGRDMADAWSERSGFTRRVGLYLRHPELGADRIRLADGPEEAARWAAAHHTPDAWGDTGLPEVVVVALVAADDD
jgi:hypothetical protein